MTDRSRLTNALAVAGQDVQWVCLLCDGAEESARGFEPPNPPVCHSCARRLRLMKALTSKALDAVLAADPACRTADAHTFTSPDVFDDEPESARQLRENTAKAVCQSCPARLACLTYALSVRPLEGVWAGYTADELRGYAVRSEVA
ncbi:WhiB family transcriptional regulator [Nonomuraea wenchangensis]|uniref:WhiB family transcriptional regulator n=1 Tax=Nonomuraea wenchangensis TaxID=568860 RepID=UPI003437C0A5